MYTSVPIINNHIHVHSHSNSENVQIRDHNICDLLHLKGPTLDLFFNIPPVDYGMYFMSAVSVDLLKSDKN